MEQFCNLLPSSYNAEVRRVIQVYVVGTYMYSVIYMYLKSYDFGSIVVSLQIFRGWIEIKSKHYHYQLLDNPILRVASNFTVLK